MSLIPEAVCHRCQRHKFAADIVDTGGKIATGINNTNQTGGKIAAGVVDTGGNFAAGVIDTGGAP
jgi:hypothetical protein